MKYSWSVYDEGNLNALVLGVEYTCYYDYLLDQVFVTFTYDFSNTICSVDSNKSITKRQFTTSPLSIKGVDAVAGVLYLNDAWRNDLTINYDNLLDRNVFNTDLIILEHEEVCEHNFKKFYGIIILSVCILIILLLICIIILKNKFKNNFAKSKQNRNRR